MRSICGAVRSGRGRSRTKSNRRRKREWVRQSSGAGVPNDERGKACQRDHRDLRAGEAAHAETPCRAVIRTIGRRRNPSAEPAKAAANHAQPCRLPLEMPEKNAPTLQPKAMRLE